MDRQAQPIETTDPAWSNRQTLGDAGARPGMFWLFTALIVAGGLLLVLMAQQAESRAAPPAAAAYQSSKHAQPAGDRYEISA